MGGIVSNIVYKVDDNKFKKISLANIEALASSAEGGVKPEKRKSYSGKKFTGKEWDVVYERSGVGESCIKWIKYESVGDSKGYCYSID